MLQRKGEGKRERFFALPKTAVGRKIKEDIVLSFAQIPIGRKSLLISGTKVRAICSHIYLDALKNAKEQLQNALKG